MTKTLKYREFDRIERLKRRAEWLRQRIELNPPKQGARNYDVGELSALEWAIPILEDHMMYKTIKSMPPEVREQFGFNVIVDEGDTEQWQYYLTNENS